MHATKKIILFFQRQRTAETDPVFRNLQQKRKLKICWHPQKDYFKWQHLWCWWRIEQGHSGSYLQVHGRQAFDGGTTEEELSFTTFIVLESFTQKAHVQFGPDFLDTLTIGVLELVQIKLKGTNYAVYEDIPKELYNLHKAQMSKFREAKRRGLKAIFSKAQPDRLFISGKFIPVNDPFYWVFTLLLPLFIWIAIPVLSIIMQEPVLFFQSDIGRFCTIALLQGMHNTWRGWRLYNLSWAMGMHIVVRCCMFCFVCVYEIFEVSE